MQPSPKIETLIDVVAELRNPDGGCPWDLAQTFASIAPYTIEEAYEVADAIEREDLGDLVGELGDLLLQVVYHARIAEEAGAFDFGDVVLSIAEKMIRRHPHVFGNVSLDSVEAATESWDQIKAAERAERAARYEARPETATIAADIPIALPALVRAAKIQRRAAIVGFDWADATMVLRKLKEEIGELEAEISAESPETDRVEDEVGDVLFTAVNLARHLGVEPETATRRANARFARRFDLMETLLRERGLALDQASRGDMETAWNSAKTLDGGVSARGGDR